VHSHTTGIQAIPSMSHAIVREPCVITAMDLSGIVLSKDKKEEESFQFRNYFSCTNSLLSGNIDVNL